jgi:hypothetical protein
LEAILGFHDTQALKQAVVLKMPLWTAFGLGALRFLGRPFGLPSPPREGGILRLLYLRAPACRRGGEEALRDLVLLGRHEAWKRGCPFAVLGLDAQDPLRQMTSHMLKVSVPSLGFAAAITAAGRKLIAMAKSLPPQEDFSIA